MQELIQVGENSFYTPGPVQVGLVRLSASEVVLIDSGADQSAARKLRQLLEERAWTLKAIFNTHSHADHDGGNEYLQKRTGCKIFAHDVECASIRWPIFEAAVLYGAYPPQGLHGKAIMAKPSQVSPLREEDLPSGFEWIPLPGHSLDQVAYRSPDDVLYLADALSSRDIIEKYKIPFIFNVQDYLDSLEKIKSLRARVFVPAHAPAMDQADDLIALAQYNIDQTLEMGEIIVEKLKKPQCMEALLQALFRDFGLEMNLTQRFLDGATLKAYLTWLSDLGKIEYRFEDGLMVWQKIKA